MAALVAWGRRLRELSRAGGRRGVKTPPGAAPPPPPAEDPEFQWVRRLLPPTRVPQPPPHPTYPTPSGWSPPAGPPPELPYLVWRSRLHNLPVYGRTRNGNRRLTELRRAAGDLWALERDLRADLGVREVQVDEVTGRLRLRGAWEGPLREWLLGKGF